MIFRLPQLFNVGVQDNSNCLNSGFPVLLYDLFMLLAVKLELLLSRFSLKWITRL